MDTKIIAEVTTIITTSITDTTIIIMTTLRRLFQLLALVDELGQHNHRWVIFPKKKFIIAIIYVRMFIFAIIFYLFINVKTFSFLFYGMSFTFDQHFRGSNIIIFLSFRKWYFVLASSEQNTYKNILV